MRFLRCLPWIFPLLLSLAAAPCFGADEVPALRVLDSTRYLLGMPGEREWSFFDGQVLHGPSLEINFSAQRNSQPCTLFMRQQDVKLNWPVKMNGRVIGKLDLMEGN